MDASLTESPQNTRPPSSGLGKAFARTEAERTFVREHRTAAKTQPKPEIGGRRNPTS
jgi:hypothetical protein